MKKHILGLDIGSNSVGWALVKVDENRKPYMIEGMGSRIIPMSQDVLGNFNSGVSLSQTAERTGYRGVRRLRERHLLRRERLHRVLHIIDFLPSHYANQIDFEKRLGQFTDDSEPKLAWRKNINGKFEFIFQSSFNEMVIDFKNNHQSDGIGHDGLIPYDWTIYYLRKKALTQKIEKEELAWIILNFNQKRGYYQLRGEEEEQHANKLVEFYALKVVDIVPDDNSKSKNGVWYSLHLENGWIYRRSSKTPLNDWKGKTKEFIVTTDLNEDGTIKTDKEGNEKRSFRAPSPDDWTLLKKKTEADVTQSKKTVGTYIYDTLVINPRQKIIGKLIRTIERKFYKDELRLILEKQAEFHPELQDEDLYYDAVRELYRNNESHQILLDKRNFTHLFLNDIIFYQRPLRSKKSTISNCSFEYRIYKDKEDIKQKVFLKATSKSNPYFQEFRLWQWIYNLSIYKREDDVNVTNEFLNSTEDYENLFCYLNNRVEIKQELLLRYLFEQKGYKGKSLTLKISQYRWNFIDDKEKSYPCNETRGLIITRLSKVDNLPEDFLDSKIEYELWHLIYSVTDKKEYETALRSFAKKHGIDEISFLQHFQKIPPFKNEYGSYSEKAIKKLLQLMRVGKHWDWQVIDEKTKQTIDNLINGEYDENIKERVREKAIHLRNYEDFQGLPLWLASYIVYGRHSEASSLDKWQSITDLNEYLKEFKQHSLKNPIVEQIITETLRVVRDIWQQYGKGENDFFSEIHIELGREMKLPSEERKRLTTQVLENENTNLRIKSMLLEMSHYPEVENVRPFSPMQQEALKIFEDGVLNSNLDIDDDILKISKSAQPTSAELRRYKLWLEQRYRSPYTGEIIPLNKLFTVAYEIEHIIPKRRFYDDSFTNKVICESAVNKLKDDQTSYEFIKNHHGQLLEVGYGKSVRIFEEEEFKKFVTDNYAKRHAKKSKLLMEEIPEKMIERQMNDTRYISKFVTNLLSNIVRSETEDEGVNSKNIIVVTGKITSSLKQDWGLNDVWNDLILPRFKRMNELLGTNNFTTFNDRYQKFLPTVPLEFSKYFQKKRIDHRHHAMDALVIACATRSHVNFLNNQHALEKGKTNQEKDKIRYDLRSKLCTKNRLDDNGNYNWQFIKPWPTFTVDTRKAMEQIIVSFKQNLRVINKSVNYYQHYVNGVKVIDKQTKGDNWAIRKPLHKDTVSGLVKLRKIKSVSLKVAIDNYLDVVDRSLRKKLINFIDNNYDTKKILKFFKDNGDVWNNQSIKKVDIYYWDDENVASRVNLDTSFSEKNIIDKITDKGIQKILLNHLENYKGIVDDNAKEIAPETLAFTPEGIEVLNENIVMLNNGKFHQPIHKVRTYETKGSKFLVGSCGNKRTKYVESAKGTNLFCAVYVSVEGKRSYETIPLNIVIERLKQGLIEVPEFNKSGDKLLFSLSPNDLVYVPQEGEDDSPLDTSLDRNRIYKMVSSTGNQVFFIKSEVATSIVNKVEYSALNKMEKSIDGIMIKQTCIKLKVNRLGMLEF